MACILRSFASAGAVRVLRLCCCPHYFAEEDDEEFYAGLEQLDGPALVALLTDALERELGLV